MPNLIRIILAILMLLCLLNWPYSYYQMVRFVSMLGLAYLALDEFRESKEFNNKVFMYIALAILFQPLFKISLGRTLWNIVDVVVAIYLFYEVWKSKQINKA